MLEKIVEYVIKSQKSNSQIGAEETTQESAYDPKSLLKPYNPDDLWQKTGDYSIYEEMLTDEQVDVALQIKKDLVLASGWDIVVDDESMGEIRDDVEIALIETPDKSLDDMLEEVISAYEFGFSISEKIFTKRDDNKIGLKALKTRHPNTWLIETDSKGNIEKYLQQGVEKNIPIDPKKLIHYINKGRFQNQYGTSDLRSCYTAWFIKKHIVKYYSIFLEKAASPTPIARYDKNIPAAAIETIFKAIKKLQTKSAMVIPKDVEIELLESKSKGEAYIKGINIFNMFIGRALFVPDLLGYQGEETTGGSFSLGVEQIGVFFKHIDRRRKSLQRIINEEIIKPIVIWNYGEQESYPKLVFRPIKDDDINIAIKAWIEVVKGRVYRPSDEEINHFRKLIKFPEGEVIQPEIPQEDLKENPKEKEKEKEKEKPNENKENDKQKESQFAKVFNFPSGDYHKKVDFKKIETQMDNSLNAMIDEADPLIKKIYEDMYDQMEKKNIVGGQKINQIDSIKLKNLKSFKQLIKSNLKDVYSDSKRTAQSELFKSDFANLSTPSQIFLDALEQESFDYVGDWEYRVTAQARTAMLNAIKDGKPLSSVIDIMEEESRRAAMVSVERYSRTKITESFNKGRLEFFNDSGVVSGYQYSAILDGRTTAICRGLHGKKFKSGTEPIPPMHFNCRSLLIPITKFESFDPDSKVGKRDINEFIEEEKGTGFPKE